MDQGSKKSVGVHEGKAVTLGELIHERVRHAIETAVDEELAAALGAASYERTEARRGYRNGQKTRTLTGPTGPLALTLPRGVVFAAAGGGREWTSRIVPRYQRRVREVNEAVVATYLAGGNTRRIRGALAPLLKAAPLSKSAVSRIVATLREGLAAWMTRALREVDLVYLYLDALTLRVRSAGKVVSVPVLTAVGVLADGEKQLLALELCGAESADAWAGFVDALISRGLKPPCNGVACTSCGISSAKRPSMRSPSSARTSIASSTPPVARAPGPPTPPVRASGARAVRGSPGVSRRAATSCSPFSASPRRSGRRCGPRTPLNASTKSFGAGSRPRGRCRPRTPPSACSSASWPRGRFGCARSTATRNSRR